MAPLVPYDKAKADPEWLRQSKGVDTFGLGRGSNNSIGTAIGTGLQEGARALNTSIEAVDNYEKDNIDRRLFAEINAERTESIDQGLDLLNTGTSPSPTQPRDQEMTYRGEPAEGVPTAIVNGERKMAMWTQANRMGKFEDIGYYGRMQEIVQRLSSEHPRHAIYVANKAAGFLGTNPANAMRSAIQSSLSQLANARDKSYENWERFLTQKAEYFILPDGKFDRGTWEMARTAYGNPEKEAHIRTFVAEQEASKHGTSMRIQQMEELAKARKFNSEEAESGLHDEANRISQRVMTRVTFPITIAGKTENVNFQQAQQIYGKMQQNPQADPEELTALGHVLGLYQKRIETDIRLYANNTMIGGKSISAWISNRDKIENVVKQYATDLMAPMIRDVGAGNLDSATRDATSLTMWRNNMAMRGTQLDIIRLFSQLGPLEGPAAAAVITSIIGSNPGSFAGFGNDVAEALRRMNSQEMSSPNGSTKPKSFFDLQQRYLQATPQNLTAPRTTGDIQRQAEYNHKIVEDARDILTHESSTNRQRLNAALTISHRDNTKFLESIKPEQRISMFRKMTTQEITDGIFEQGKKNPQIWEDYKTTVQQLLMQSFGTSFGNITQGAQDTFGANIRFDEKAGRFTFFDPANRQSLESARRSAMPPISATAQRSINEVNAAMQSYKYMLEKGGEKLDEEHLAALGIYLKPQPTNPTSGSPNGSKGPSTKGKQSNLRELEDTGIPPNAQPASGMGLGIEALANAQGLQLTPRQRLRLQEHQMEMNLSNQGPLEQEREEAGILGGYTFEQDVAFLPENQFESRTRPGRPRGEGGGGGAPTGIKKYEIIDTETGKTVGNYNTPNRSWHNRALKRLEKLNDGGDRYQLRPIMEKPSPVGPNTQTDETPMGLGTTAMMGDPINQLLYRPRSSDMGGGGIAIGNAGVRNPKKTDEPANMNRRSGQIDDPYMDAQIEQSWKNLGKRLVGSDINKAGPAVKEYLSNLDRSLKALGMEYTPAQVLSGLKAYRDSFKNKIKLFEEGQLPSFSAETVSKWKLEMQQFDKYIKRLEIKAVK